MAFFHSIRFRLTLWFVAILALVLVTFSTLIYWTQSRELRSDAVGHLQEEIEQLQGRLNPEMEEFSLPPSGAPESGVQLSGGDLLILADPAGSILQQWGAEIGEPGALMAALLGSAGQQREPVADVRQVELTGQDGQVGRADYLLVAAPIDQEGRLIGYLVMGRRTDLISQQHRLAVSLALGCLGMLVIAFLGGVWIADRAMRPVASIASAARNITESDLGRRLNMRGRDELADLAATFDGMISRLQTAFDRQRRFVADASHELRTPLTIINLEAGRMLEGQRPAGAYRHALQVIAAEGATMTRLVNDLLTLARMDSGQTILHSEQVALSDVARQAVARIAPLALQRHVRLESGNLAKARVTGDRQYLLQMASNLLENGVKYSGDGQQVRIEILCTRGNASLRVTDTGPGIPPEHLPAVFDRFYRVDQTRSKNEDDPRSPSGSGLGLSIVAWIVHAHGGEIRVDSRINEGTTFEVILPLSQADSASS